MNGRGVTAAALALSAVALLSGCSTVMPSPAETPAVAPAPTIDLVAIVQECGGDGALVKDGGTSLTILASETDDRTWTKEGHECVRQKILPDWLRQQFETSGGLSDQLIELEGLTVVAASAEGDATLWSYVVTP